MGVLVGFCWYAGVALLGCPLVVLYCWLAGYRGARVARAFALWFGAVTVVMAILWLG